MSDLRDWIALYTMEGSARNPEPTKWDPDEVKAVKLERIARAKLR